MSEPADARRLVLLRHGRTAWNATRRIQGQADAELDATGIEQARRVAPAMAALSPVALWSSDLVRARRTAEEVARVTGLEPAYDERLREFCLGERQGLTHEEYAGLDPAEYARFRVGDWDDIPGAETAAEVAERFTAVLKEAAAGLDQGRTAVLVAHGAAIRTATVHWLGWPAATALDLRALGNCAWVELEERPAGTWRLAAYNRTA
ncbi:histidine phosphatase family protein [Nocardioides sp. TF02-7]|uniref:histidine phosphatase family protein n=1 Tax=Nocardioides sp. TF02-7 TaxID=2917724 RepID=UPI001F06F87D|nr:histidine phosphatase family protein [Nocardioides sp. TF02-7]UMG92976.1 histidine phosphatase family protein [Nocardioides sp. TF02-7]